MNKAIFTKAAAVVCSLATLSVLGISAAAQTPVPSDKDIESMTDLVDGKINIVAGVIEAQPGETVTYPVYIANNAKSGFSATGLRLVYDANLTPCNDADGNLIVNKKCTAGDDLTKRFTLNTEQNLIGVGTMGADPEKDNGVMFTVALKVPDDAQAGDIYPMTLEIDKWLDAETNPLECATFDGCIFIGDGSDDSEITEEPGKTDQKEKKDKKEKKAKKDKKDKKENKSKARYTYSGDEPTYDWYHSIFPSDSYWYEAGRWHSISNSNVNNNVNVNININININR